MGVYIKDIEIPTNCRVCRFCAGQTNMDYGVCAWCAVDGKVRDAYTKQDCPLISVPKPHGKLIDVDILEKEVQKRMLICNKNDNQFQKPYEIMRAIVLASTIIPASEESEI